MISPYESSRIASTGVKRKASGGQGLRFYASNGWVRRRFEVNDKADASTRASTIPPDDLSRQLTLVGPSEDAKLKHVALAGGIYTMLLTGEDTAKKFCLIDMQIPPGGGPVPHRHNFEETFTVLEGECVVTFRGRKVTVRAGETANVPANAPHYDGARSLYVRAGGSRRILSRGRNTGAVSPIPTAGSQRCREGRHRQESPSPCSTI